MDFQEFKSKKIYNVFSKIMKVSSAIYFLQKEKGCAPYSHLERCLQDNGITFEELDISLKCLEKINELEYDVGLIEDEIDGDHEDFIYKLTPVAYDGLEQLMDLMTQKKR